MHATVKENQRAVWLELAQRDEGLRTVWAASGELLALIDALLLQQKKLSYTGITAVIEAVASHVRTAWFETRGGYLRSPPR